MHDEAARRLGSAVDARRITERAAGFEGSHFVIGLDEDVPARAVPFFQAMVERRATGEPLQYVVQRWGFRHLDLFVDRRVLIPRPETEQVVEAALGEARRLGDLMAGPGPGSLVVADLGTGSGAIALSLALELPGAEVWATDRSTDALAVARANLAGVGTLVATRVRLAEGSWFAALPDDRRGRLDLIVSNPPYVAEDDQLPSEVADWEPTGALVAGPSGLEDIELIVAGAPDWLSRPGALVLELAPHQAEAVLALALAAGFAHAEVRPDLAGRPRALVARI